MGTETAFYIPWDHGQSRFGWTQERRYKGAGDSRGVEESNDAAIDWIQR
jgi:hypothetical protein